MEAHTQKNSAKNILKLACDLNNESRGISAKRKFDKVTYDCFSVYASQFQDAYKEMFGVNLYKADGKTILDTAQGLNRAITTSISEFESLMRRHSVADKIREDKVNSLKHAVVKIEDNPDVGDPAMLADKNAVMSFINDLI